MPRPSQADDKRREYMPVIARAFVELGYRRATTAALAERCGIRENILYRLWPDKKAMFIAAIEYVYAFAQRTWASVVNAADPESNAKRLLAYESEHLGEFGHARIVFAGLCESDDPEIRQSLKNMYRSYQAFVEQQIRAHRSGRRAKSLPDPMLTAWAVIGLGTASTIIRELKLLSDRDRARLLGEIGLKLLG